MLEWLMLIYRNSMMIMMMVRRQEQEDIKLVRLFQRAMKKKSFNVVIDK